MIYIILITVALMSKFALSDIFKVRTFDDGKIELVASFSFEEGLSRLQNSQMFRQEIAMIIRRNGHRAVFFECPPVTAGTMNRSVFRFVLVPAPVLAEFASTASDIDFKEHFTLPGPNGYREFRPITFPNLSGDAVLVVPEPSLPEMEHVRYGHLADFVRTAPAEQLHAFLSAVGSAALARIRQRGDAPTWLSTCGTGVRWLHVRLDSRPKYYSHVPFKTM